MDRWRTGSDVLSVAHTSADGGVSGTLPLRRREAAAESAPLFIFFGRLLAMPSSSSKPGNSWASLVKNATHVLRHRFLVLSDGAALAAAHASYASIGVGTVDYYRHRRHVVLSATLPSRPPLEPWVLERDISGGAEKCRRRSFFHRSSVARTGVVA